MTEHEKRRRRAAADIHLNFVVELYRQQMAGGRYFLHEHPAYAQSWQVKSIAELLADVSVGQVVACPTDTSASSSAIDFTCHD